MTQPTRPYDALYDNTFTVAGPRDHYRQQTLGGGFNIERAPIYNNFFSELPHYPPSTLRLKNGDRLPAFIDRNFHQPSHDPADLQQRSDALAVSGNQRPKYFRRPLLAAAEIHVKQAPLPPLPQYQDLNATAPAAMAGSGGPEPRSKTIGTQSDYRENEAQTAPWEPGYILPEQPTIKQQALSKRFHSDGPEVLHLRDMAFADGLPAGLQEVTRIDKMRAKRAFEATLPPIDDAARLPLRQKMIEEWEAREWEEREQEILDIQERRLALLDNALQVREEELDEDHRQRVEERKKATLAARAGRFADVQATRIKTMRQLIENRKYVEKHRKLHKPTIVERYANFGSGTYAPLQREGRFPESKPMGQEIETEGYEPASLKGLLELEAFLPTRLLNPKMTAPKRPDRLDYSQRKEAAIQHDLKTINDLLDMSKATAGRGFGDCWPAPLQEDSIGGPGLGNSGSLKRASSSSLSKSGGQSLAPASAGGVGAGPLLPPAASGGAATGGAGGAASPPRRVMRAVERPATPELPVPPALSQPQQAALVLLQRLLRGRAAQNIMYEGRLRRQELIDELRLSERLSADGAQLDGKFIRRPEARDAATLRLDALLGSTVSEVCAVLSEADPSKREVLIAALDTSHAHAAAAATAASTDFSAEHSSTSSLPPAPPPAPSLQEAALNLEALGISREQAEEAATRIQAAFHGHQARKEVAAMRARGAMLRRIMADGDEGKVIKCQAAVRGYLDRKHVREIRESQAAAGDHAGAAAPKAQEGVAEVDKEEGEEAEERQRRSDFMFDPSSYSSEQVAAATRIQAVMRQRFAQRRIALIHADKASGGVQAEATTAGDNETPPPPPPPPPQLNPEYTVEQEVAVIKIQAARRGYLARRRIAELRTEQQPTAAEGAGPRRPTVIGRQDDVGLPNGFGGEYGATEAEKAAAEAGVDDAGANTNDGDALWPKVHDLPGFVLTPAAPSGDKIEPLPEMTPRQVEAEASLMGGSAEDGVVPAAAEAMPEDGPSLAVGSSDSGDGDEPQLKPSVVTNGDDEAVAAGVQDAEGDEEAGERE
ncbi:hypothetical protein Vafri_8117, partial [Volvox africanus]